MDAMSCLERPLEPETTILALDIDGTTVTEDQEIPEKLEHNIVRLRDGGVHICITTGRSVPATLPVVAGLHLKSAWLATSNGSIIGHWTANEGYKLTYRYTFDAREAVSRLLAVVPDAFIGIDDGYKGFRVNRRFPPGELRETTAIEPLERLLEEPVSRVVVRVPRLSNAEFRRIVEGIDFGDVERSIGWRSWLDLNPSGTSKALGLKTVCERLEVSQKHTVALGDGANDIPVLRWAAYGVAMGIASPAVKAAADNTTLAVEDNGSAAVAEALAITLGL